VAISLLPPTLDNRSINLVPITEFGCMGNDITVSSIVKLWKNYLLIYPDIRVFVADGIHI
jgi:hypothetical protein